MTHAILLLTLLHTAGPDVTTAEEAVPAVSRDTLRDNAVLSARGPRTGRGAVSLATTLIFYLPMADFRWVYGVSDLIQTELQIRVGFFDFAEFHTRFRLVDKPRFSFALRAGAHGILAPIPFNDVEGAGGGGPSAGMMMSFGGESVQVTITVDGRYIFSSDGHHTWMGSPAAGLEFSLGHPLNGFFEAKLLTTSGTDETIFFPFFSHGISW